MRLRVYPEGAGRFQQSDNTIIGQKVAAMPDHPKMLDQKIVRPGTKVETNIAMARVVPARSGCSIC